MTTVTTTTPPLALAPENQNAGAYRFRVGDITATAVSDGQDRFPAYPGYAANASRQDVEEVVRDLGWDDGQYLLNITALLLHVGDQTILVDAGAGAAMGTGFGRLPAALRTLGVSPETIDTVHITHGHLDHLGGLATSEGRAAYPGADLSLTRSEWEYWTDPTLELSALPIEEAFQQALVQVPQAVLPLYGDRLALFDEHTELGPGVTATRTPGHTPGHSVVHVDSADQRLLIVGDLFHNPAFDLAHPHWCTAFDDRPDQTPGVRLRVLGEAADRGDLVFACHAPFPGVGRVLRDADAFRFVPASWQLQP